MDKFCRQLLGIEGEIELSHGALVEAWNKLKPELEALKIEAENYYLDLSEDDYREAYLARVERIENCIRLVNFTDEGAADTAAAANASASLIGSTEAERGVRDWVVKFRAGLKPLRDDLERARRLCLNVLDKQ